MDWVVVARSRRLNAPTPGYNGGLVIPHTPTQEESKKWVGDVKSPFILLPIDDRS